MSADPRAAVVAEVLAEHRLLPCDRMDYQLGGLPVLTEWEECQSPHCHWSGAFGEHLAHRASAVLVALDAYTAAFPFGGRIPPVDPEWGNKPLGGEQ